MQPFLADVLLQTLLGLEVTEVNVEGLEEEVLRALLPMPRPLSVTKLLPNQTRERIIFCCRGPWMYASCMTSVHLLSMLEAAA